MQEEWKEFMNHMGMDNLPVPMDELPTEVMLIAGKINKTCEQFKEMLLAERLCQYLGVERLTMEILDNLLEQVLVFPDGRFEIRWKFRDELELLRQMALK